MSSVWLWCSTSSGGIFQLLSSTTTEPSHHLLDLLPGWRISSLGHRALLLGGGGDLAVHVGHSLHLLHYGGELGTAPIPAPPLVLACCTLGHQFGGLSGIGPLQLPGSSSGSRRWRPGPGSPVRALLGGDHGEAATRLAAAPGGS